MASYRINTDRDTVSTRQHWIRVHDARACRVDVYSGSVSGALLHRTHVDPAIERRRYGLVHEVREDRAALDALLELGVIDQASIEAVRTAGWRVA